MPIKQDDLKFSPRQTTLVDSHVGKRLRKMRKEAQITQEKLGEIIGKSFKQIRKYEHGKNRISSSVLFALSKELNVRIESFFTGLDRPISDKNYVNADITTAEVENLIKSYYSMKAPFPRTEFLTLIRAISDSDEDY